MNTIRRLYLYAVAFISLEVITWGLISLARSIFSGGQIGNNAAQLAGALALIFVGLPVFLLHWWLAQRASLADDEERSSRSRAFFLYGALFATLIPVAQNGVALINRIWLQIYKSSFDFIIDLKMIKFNIKYLVLSICHICRKLSTVYYILTRQCKNTYALILNRQGIMLNVLHASC